MPPGLIRRIICLAIHLSFATLFWYAYRIRYGNHIDCFNELGRCYIPGEGVLTTSGAFWGFFALIFGALALWTLIRLGIALWRHRRLTLDQD